MLVFVLNAGSSSLKYQLMNPVTKKVLASGICERIGIDGVLKHEYNDGKKLVLNEAMPTHKEAINAVLTTLTSGEGKVIESTNDIEAIGHRTVHGGEEFASSVLITPEVVETMKRLSPLAPLHNPANILGIEICQEVMPGKPNVGVFDTAFHQTMPDYAYMYGLPYSLYKKYGIRRYGFHGTSYRFVSQRACDVLGVPYEKQRIITAHIGNGGSITAIKDGKSIDTTMGLTPVEGLLMGTRCGDVDAGALSFIMDKEGLNAAGLSDLINKQSGVMGLSNISSDMREIEAAIEEGDKKAILTMNVFNYRIKKYIGAYAAALGGLDILVFTGGVGENQWSTRTEVCRDMEFMGIKLDEAKNDHMRGKEMVISTPDSKVTVIVVPTDEELTIAKDTLEILSK